MTEPINEAGYIKGVQVLTEKEQICKDKLQAFIKDHPIVKRQEKFDRMEAALTYIVDWSYDKCAVNKAREAMKED